MTAIASIPISTSVAGSAPPAGFDAEQAKCERQLADWVHCASARTPEGKAKIAQLAAKLSVIQARVEQAAASKADAVRSAKAPDAVAAAQAPAATPILLSPLGHRVDAYA